MSDQSGRDSDHPLTPAQKEPPEQLPAEGPDRERPTPEAPDPAEQHEHALRAAEPHATQAPGNDDEFDRSGVHPHDGDDEFSDSPAQLHNDDGDDDESQALGTAGGSEPDQDALPQLGDPDEAGEPVAAQDSDGVEDPEASDEPEDPSLAELLAGTARGETASFSAFFESTADVVYGMALLMHAEAEGAHASTVAVYQHLWDQADVRARDLRLQTQASETLTDEYAGFYGADQLSDQPASDEDPETYRPNEYELVLEWLVPLAHRIFVERFREGAAAPIPLSPVPQSEGGGVAGLPEEVLDDMLALSDSQAQALALTYLAGLTHQQVAQTVEAAIPSVKSRLRDAMTRLHNQRTERAAETDPILRAAVTRRDVERSGGVNRNFSNEISADLDKGLLVELAELYALDAVDDRERALLDEKALTADAQEAQQWETRVLAARRTLAEVFASDPVAPPSSLLEGVLHSVGDQEVGVGLVEDISNHTGEEVRRTPVLKRWMFIAGFLAILLIGGIVIWQVSAPQDVQGLAASDPEAAVVEDYEMAQGGQLNAVFSEAEDVGHIEFSDVPELEGDATYQLWLMPADAAEPSSLGNFTAEELEADGVDIHTFAAYRSLLITVEDRRGEERPQGETVAEIPLR
ncbi:anti-sigma factor [Nesterenkonia sp.]|uniref:anti-sigma factor domain-containing protein n=1 Tax=Nesterenkonia sp. TaxID=704201 RepID=UPI00262F0158|nr:anti-sigma factor [Nesterenkonia sp.]